MPDLPTLQNTSQTTRSATHSTTSSATGRAASWLQRWRGWRPAGQCLVCGHWNPAAVCARCLHRWAPEVPRCSRCGINLQGLPHLDGVCMDCEAHGPEFDRALAALDYDAPWSTLMARLKFQDACHLAPWLADRLASAWHRRPQRASVILPLPISARRLQERGYNQSALVAQALGRRLQLPVAPQVLHRVKHTERLMRLNPDDRQAAISGAFAVNPALRRQVLGRHVAVVDDVMTTGATLNEAALTLREAGARSVCAWVVARTGRSPRLMSAPT